jgi:hypothetical protein
MLVLPIHMDVGTAYVELAGEGMHQERRSHWEAETGK